MVFVETKLRGVYIIKLEKLEDERGFFARTFCQHEFEAHGLNPQVAQCSVSFNKKKGTLRGLHYQVAPYEEAKVLRCTMGAIFDVVLDLRRDSPTFQQWIGVELTVDNRRMLYIPAGCAHGFETLADDTEVLYQMSEFFHPEAARGLLWNDPKFGIEWPLEPVVMSAKDRNYPASSPQLTEDRENPCPDKSE